MDNDELGIVPLVLEAGAMSAKLLGMVDNDSEVGKLINEIDSRLSIIESMLLGKLEYQGGDQPKLVS